MYDIPQLKLIPIASILKLYGIPVFKRSDTEMVCDCPLPSHAESSKEHKRTFAIGLEKNKWFCHSTSCQRIGNHKGGDGIDLVARLDNLTAKDALKKLSESFACGKPHEAGSNAVNGTTHPPSKNPPLAFELKHLDPNHPYIRERGINLETAMEFKIGFHAGKGSMSNRICFPLHEDGAIVGYAGRLVAEPTAENPRWKLPAGLHRTFLYGLERCSPDKLLYVVEGCWAVLHLFQHGVQSCALLGSSLTESQERLLDPFAEIRVCLDNDSAGHEAATKIAERLKGKHKVSRAYLKK